MMEQEDNQPLLFVDVNLGVGKQERIVVCDGDRADELAERFATMHSNLYLINHLNFFRSR